LAAISLLLSLRWMTLRWLLMLLADIDIDIERCWYITMPLRWYWYYWYYAMIIMLLRHWCHYCWYAFLSILILLILLIFHWLWWPLIIIATCFRLYITDITTFHYWCFRHYIIDTPFHYLILMILMLTLDIAIIEFSHYISWCWHYYWLLLILATLLLILRHYFDDVLADYWLRHW
jgi:hypothetical protein